MTTSERNVMIAQRVKAVFEQHIRGDNPLELYSDAKGKGEAQRAILSKLRSTMKWMLGQPCVSSKGALVQMALNRMGPTMTRFNDQGAGDSEPYYHIERALRAALE